MATSACSTHTSQSLLRGLEGNMSPRNLMLIILTNNSASRGMNLTLWGWDTG